jgi:hypothetical protein
MKAKESFQVGGQCEYKAYKGQGKIVAIIPAKGSDRSKEEYEIKFLFYPEQKIKEAYAQIEGREFQLLINNNYYPRKTWIQKYDLKVGGIFNCTMQVMVKGTCTPLMFEFPFIEEIQ